MLFADLNCEEPQLKPGPFVPATIAKPADHSSQTGYETESHARAVERLIAKHSTARVNQFASSGWTCHLQGIEA